MVYADIEYLWFLLILIPVIVWYLLKNKKAQASLKFSSLVSLEGNKKPVMFYLRHLLFVLRLIVLALLIIIIARPQSISTEEEVKEGIDIVIALDISGSMLAQDFKPNRLEASKDIAIEFINKQEYDRIGLVVFSGESFTQCPVTLDHAILINMFKEIKQGMIEDGTAIGHGLATAVNAVKDSKSKSKIVILLTDGENNAGSIDPMIAADLAAKYNIKVYTIGVGKNGFADVPALDIFGRQTTRKEEVKIDEETLKIISEKTGGKYYRATDNEKLKSIYAEINKLEKDKIKEKYNKKREEKYMIFLFPALILLLSEVILRLTILRSFP